MFDCVVSSRMADQSPAPVATGPRADVQRRLRELIDRFGWLSERSTEPPDEASSIERMQRTIASQQVRLERLEHEAAAVLAEIARLEDEVHGRERALALLLGHVVGRMERMHRDAWSPTPIVGYRLWAMRNGELHGARRRWKKPVFVATCATHGEGAPHADERCGRLGCGVYATKALEPLLAMHVQPDSHSYAAAAVALTGRVVEHERGYRAAAAQVTAAYAVWPDRVMATTDGFRLAALFSACDRIPSAWCEPWSGDSPFPELIEYLTNQLEESWI